MNSPIHRYADLGLTWLRAGPRLHRPLADLLLTKLRGAEVTAKDVADVIAVRSRLDALGSAISEKPKTMSWKAWAVLGDRIGCRQTPEEPRRRPTAHERMKSHLKVATAAVQLQTRRILFLHVQVLDVGAISPSCGRATP